jgi:alpha-glucosidase (family GH31 glycosyl hydrolase)
MCYCDPNIRTPFCGSQAFIDAAKEAGHTWYTKEKEDCCSKAKNQCWNNDHTKFVCFHCGKKYTLTNNK